MLTLTEAAEVVEAASNAGLNAYAPALIGLVGVFLGGIIQVVAQRRSNVEQQVHELRHECADLTSAATRFVSGVFTRINTQANIMSSTRTRPDLGGTGLAPEQVADLNRVVDAHYDSFREVYDKSLVVASRRDHSVAEQAKKLHAECLALQTEAVNHLNGQPSDGTAASRHAAAIQLEVEVLRRMVAPREREGYRRFRSRDSVAEEAKQAVEDSTKADAKPAS